MTHEPEALRHPGPEMLAAFAEGRTDSRGRAEMIEHLDRCEECMHEVTLAIRADRDETGTRSRWSAPAMWLGAAAAVVALMLAVGPVREQVLQAFRRDPIARLVEVAPRSARTIEPRLSGGFAWAAWQGPARAEGDRPDAARYRLAGVAGELVERAGQDRSADAQHAAGIALVLMQDPAAAMQHLEQAARTRGDAAAWSDLAAARYAAAAAQGRAALYPQALAAADAALRIESGRPEALFNRALILERMGLFDEARRAWNRYLEVDPSSPWANEARVHLRELPATTRSSQFDADRPRAERAALAGDMAALQPIVDGSRERTRAFAEAEYLGRWGEAFLAGNGAEADRSLAIARRFGDALRRISGESLLHDAVAAIDRADDARRRAIAEAHVAYRRGRIAYSRTELAPALADLDRAAATFRTAGSPMAFLARYYAASVRLADLDVAGARAELERQLAETDPLGRYIILRAAIRWELGRIRLLEDDAGGAVPILSEGAALYRRAGEHANGAFLDTMLAIALLSLGRADDGWNTRVRAFATLSREGSPRLLATSVFSAVRAELLAGRTETALALLRLAPPGHITAGHALDALVARAILEGAAGDEAAALAAVQQARQTAAAMSDAPHRARWMATIDVAAAAAVARRDPRGATALLTRSIDFFRTHDLPFALPEPLLLRARCALRIGDSAAAGRDLEEGMTLVERHPATLGKVEIGAAVLHAERALFEEAIRLALSRGDTAAAFRIAERAHGAPFTIAELQERLRGTGSAVLRVIALEDEVVAIAIDERDVDVARRKLAGDTLASLAADSLAEEGTRAAAALYDYIVRPVEPVLSRARQLIVIPDRRAATVPWAALYDTTARRHLIEQQSVAVAAAARTLVPEDGAKPRSATVVALPAAGGQAALAEADRELLEVTAVYPEAVAIAPERGTLAAALHARTDVLHLAGHTERQPSAGEHALLFTPPAGAGIERVTARTIADGPRLHARVVVLAACETLRHPVSSLTRAPSLAEAFAATGAGNVIGTLTPVGDRDARRLFRTFHRELAAGARAADALRAAQRLALHEQHGGGSRAWRAVALLTSQLPRKER